MQDNNTLVLPWLGGPRIFGYGRAWKCLDHPPNPGWFSYHAGALRKAHLASPHEVPPNLEALDGLPLQKGYLVANRFVARNAPIRITTPLLPQTSPVFCIPQGNDWLQPATVAVDPLGRLLFVRPEWHREEDRAVLDAFHDRQPTLAGIKHVTPALDLAFRWASQERTLTEQRRAAQVARLEQERRLEEATRNGQTAVGRRILAEADFDQAATLALQQGDAVFLNSQDYGPGQRLVRYRCHGHRLECVVDIMTLGILDAGVCLSANGIRGDSLFTLESLPGVIREAIAEDALVVLRH